MTNTLRFRSGLPVLLICIFLLCGCGRIHVLESNGSAREKLDIVLMPSHHYLSDPGEDAQWLIDANTVKEKLLNYPLFSAHRSRMNIYRLDISTEDDYHIGSFTPNQIRIKEFVKTLLPFMDYGQNDQIIFITYSDGFRRQPGAREASSPTRGDPNLLQIESSRLGVLIHEFGHSFGRLGDEYPKSYTRDVIASHANIASDHPGNTCMEKWGDLFSFVVETDTGTWVDTLPAARTVGCHNALQDGSPGSRYAPTQAGCVMDQINEEFPFCPVCIRELEALFEGYSL